MKHAILIVDDDMLILNTLKEKFSKWDLDLFEARTPQEARDMLQKITPDVVLLDWLLAQGGGSQSVLDYITTEPRLEQVPVLVLTNMENEELKTRLLEQGVKEYVVKGSIGLDDLYEKVRSYLEPVVGNK